MEQEASGSAGLLAAVVNSSFDPIISKTLDGTITSWNVAASELFGYCPEEVIGEPIRRLIPNDRQDEEDRVLARIKAGERVTPYVTVRLDKSGRLIDVLLRISPICDTNRKIIGASEIILTDVARKDAPTMLRQSEERLRSFVEHAPAPILMLDRNMVHLACSRRWLEGVGLAGVDIIGRHHYEVLPNIPESWKDAHRRGLAGEVVSADEEIFCLPGGGMHFGRWEVRPWFTANQSIGGITIMFEDVTERVEAQRALRESETLMRLAQEAARAGAWEWSLKDNRVQWSDSLWSLSGLQKPEQWEATFEAWASMIFPADQERVAAAMNEAAALNQEFEIQWRLNQPEGEPERWLLFRGKPITDANGAPTRYFGVAIDITEQKRLEETVLESKERLKFALEAGEVGTWEILIETGEVTASARALSFVDLPPDARPSFPEILARIHPDDQRAADEALQRAAETGNPFKIEWRRSLPDGSIRWLETRGERRSVSGKQVIGGLIQDITTRIQQKEEVEKAAKAKSEFLSNMSHELRTPMHAILGYLEISLTAIDEGDTQGTRKFLENIGHAGKRLLNLLNDLLSLAKMDAGRVDYKKERADLKDVIEHALMELDPLIKAKNLHMSVNLDRNMDAVFDKPHMTQVLVNLLSNAIKFSSAGGHITIAPFEERSKGGETAVGCRITDEGPGVPDDELEAVFDKFIQSSKTRTGAGGTGLGLAICRAIIEGHGGKIWAENSKPKGAVFSFVIPRRIAPNSLSPADARPFVAA